MSENKVISCYKDTPIIFETSYFYWMREIDKLENHIPVSICIWDPKWFKGSNITCFVPKKYDSNTDCEACAQKNRIDCKYLNNYRAQLDNLFSTEFNKFIDYIVENIIDQYLNIYNGELDFSNPIHIIFLGYENKETLCTERYVLADKLEEYYFKNNNKEICIEELNFKRKSES